ncbi:hypothetical protein GCM10007854_02880 [Algimonas porphyrae]|uniref:Secreted protein n=1 Tax=Algimonas porphyrae TaxID=1128113 RepID=A0ABQ5UW07_9PROT|nr:hypothetical protein GCM10007854_02880 [Algimonas porphyrae]
MVVAVVSVAVPLPQAANRAAALIRIEVRIIEVIRKHPELGVGFKVGAQLCRPREPTIGQLDVDSK